MLSIVSTAAWALSEVDGVYQIGSAADWEEFAALVNGGEVNACAVLTDDIDTGIDGTMIGVADAQGQRYDGTFDGKGHTIKINLYPEAGDAGIFRYIGWRAVIQNLKVTGTITTANKFAAGIVGRGRGTVRNCWSDVVINSSVPGDATHGGIVAVGYSGTIVENCLVQTAIKGETTQNCGGVVGWAENPVNIVNCLVVSDESAFDISNGLSRNISRNDNNVNAIDVETYNADPYGYRGSGARMGACYNNYVTNDWGGSNPAVTVVATEDLADGRICYQLNNDQSRIGWAQEIGVDAIPVPAVFGGKQVYASGATDCDGKSEDELTFSNTPSNAITTAHTFDMYGVCTVCGCFNFHYFEFDDPTKFDQKDRAVLLKTKEDIDAAEGLNRMCNGFKLNMKMENDIEYVAEPGKYIFNKTDWIDGNFDGQGHAFTMDISEVDGYAGLFPEMAGNIENLILHGSLQTNGARVGSLCAEARNALIRNVYSDVDITSTVVGDNTSGGFFGWTGQVEKHVENCIYAGTLALPGSAAGATCARVGGFAGWTATTTYYTNCAVLGNIIGAGNQTLDTNTENSQNIARNPGSVVCENVYVANPIYGNSVSDMKEDGTTSAGLYHYDNEAGIASGELAFYLNGKQDGVERFYQLIGTDPEPMPIKKEGALVYSSAGQYRCDGTPIGDGISYSNSSSGGAVIPPHVYEDGWCVNCGKMQEDYLNVVDGFFEINDGAQLAWWSVYAAQHPDASAKLTDDIDMGDYMEHYTLIGNFSGTFDGQGHTISNFVLESTSSNNIGLISSVVDGAVVQNVVLDETCSLFAANYAGIIGTTSGSGTIYVTNVGFEGSVGVGTRNAAGIVGVCSGGSMNMIITNCWVTGIITSGVESGAICGYSGSGSVVKNCWSTCQMQSGSIYSSDSFTRGAAQVINCYEADIEGVAQNKQQHYNPTAANRLTITLPLEDVASGALCYNLNGKQISEPSWYQTLDEDDHPYPFDTHGVVVCAAEQYFSVPNSDLNDIVSEVQSYEKDALDGVTATQSLLDELEAAIDGLDDVETIEALVEAVGVIETAKQAVKESADAYQAYIDKCEEVKAYLESHKDFEGELRTALEEYLSTESLEPSEDNPLGSYEYIVDEHTATTEEIKAETERIIKWLADAIYSGYVAGTDISSMFVNADFSKQNEGWTGGFSNAYGETQDANGNTLIGVEAWNTTGDMYQTVEGMKTGYYLVGTNGAFRPSNNRYSTNYAAGIYANGIFNYFPAAIEDYVAVEDAVDGENCNLTIKSAYDLSIYSDDFSTSDEQAADLGAELKGYVVQGPTGMAIAAKAGRYPAYTIAYVGEDQKLTVGIKNPGTNYSNDWTGWSAIKVTYCGEDAEAVNPALDIVLENMKARAESILAYEYDESNAAAGPNFPEALKEQLQQAVAKIAEVQTPEEKIELAATFSEIFESIYEGKQAYVKLFNTTGMIDWIVTGNLALMEKGESGEWAETGEYLFTEEDKDALYAASDELIDAYYKGSYSAEEALKMEALNGAAVQEILPAQDEEGYYLIGTRKQFAAYRAIASDFDRYAKGKLTADIDMAGILMMPIGHNRGESAQHIFASVFDGQGHALTNVYIDDEKIDNQGYAEPATLFYELQNATVKNLKLTGEYYTSTQFTGGVTRYMSGTSTIDNCEIAVDIHFASNLSGDASSGAVIGYNGSANSLISNCLVNSKLIGPEDAPIWYVGGVCGWASSALKIQNTLITSQYENVGVEGDNSQTIARGAGASATNVFVTQYFRGQQGTLVSEEQLASGEAAWKLNGSTGDNAHWFQTLGAEAMPHLFSGDVVYYYGGQYTNDKPNPQLNAFAYNLDAKKVGSNVVVNFALNAEAEAAEIQFFNEEEQVYTEAVPAEELVAGEHSVTVDASGFTATNFKISVTGKGSLDVLRLGDVYKVWAPYGMAVNNNPASKGFGQVMIAETWATQYPAGYISTEKSGALFAYDQNFKPINSADGTPGFYGGLPIPQEIQDGSALIISGSLKYDMKDLQFSPDGRLFVARASGTSNSSVWEINPEDLDEPWKPVFTGGELDEATGITYVGDEEQNRMAIGLAFEGKGEDTKMYVLGGQRSDGTVKATDFNCSVYNLGTATEWTAAPSANFEPLDGVYTYQPSHVGICADGQGGLWFIQSVTASAETPAIKHFNAEGKEDYSNPSLNTGGGKVVVTPDGQYIAMPNGSGKIVIYECNYVPMENGRIFLNPKQNISVLESSIASFAFDWANNLYVASGGTETFSRYTVPGMSKVVVTPGNGIGNGASGDLNGDGKVDIADAVTVLDIMAAGTNDAAADLNGDGKVDIADFVTVLDIMAEQ